MIELLPPWDLHGETDPSTGSDLGDLQGISEPGKQPLNYHMSHHSLYKETRESLRATCKARRILRFCSHPASMCKVSSGGPQRKIS